MHPDTYLQLHRIRAAELQAQAAEHHLALQAKRPRDLRTRLGWTLVEVGLRLAAAPNPVPAV
ncbi:hypothetical protein [Streptomyces pseudovenezuelae]|uniref:Uncharacterized protein n=1 Tax=Streptomyces pseudovenezuelae TaxID=67350 RepID=A0ABT6LZF5_9ACTN|nr:hypothetical protein [Streptomyces pseudovenezuelae]MDH6221200.1 hypothetical protein [Streptomyces pseudovenezuelae]